MKRTHTENAQFFKELSLLLHAGIGLAEGLYLLAEDASEKHRELLLTMGQSMDRGAALSSVMEETGAFSTYDFGMVRTGEQTGRMEDALEVLAEYYEERQRTAHLLKNSLAYPCTVLLLMLVVIGVLLIKVLPVFDSVYASLGSGLTGIAGGLLRFGGILEAALPVLLILLAAGALAVLLFTLWESFREKTTALFRRRFGDRGLFRKFNNARFARALAMGLRSGMPLEEAMALAQLLLADIPDAAQRCKICADKITEDVDLSDAMAEAELLTPSMSRMLTTGLRGGNADRVMEDIARRMLEDATQTLDNTISRIEPVMVTLASLLVGLILLSVMLPLMNIMSTIG